jgi:hypothetical protein
MKHYIAAAVLIAIFGAQVQAQEQKQIPADVLGQLGTDLAKLQQEIQTAVAQQQKVPSKFVSVTSDKTKVFSGASTTSPVLFTAEKGQQYPVVDQVGTYYATKFGKDKYGWISASDVVPKVEPTAASADVDLWYTDPNSGKLIYFSPSSEKTAASQQTAPADSGFDLLYTKLAESAAKIRDKYAGNPYIQVVGFQVNIGLPPSLSMNFSFK